MPGYKGHPAIASLAYAAGLLFATSAFAQTAPNCPTPRKINIGVAVAPPNVVHTAPYIAKALGFFQKRCIDANIIAFEGGAAGTSVTAVAQGSAMSNLPDVAIARGLKGKQIWGLATKPPQAYVVPESIRTAADLKGKRLSAAGGVGSFNWLMGREVLRSAGLSADDAQFVSQGTAGRLPGFLTGQIEGVVLHPEDVFIAQQKKPGTRILVMLTDLLPKLSFNHYGASDAMLAKDRELVRDAAAAMLEANRTAYRDKARIVPIIMEATQKPREAVEYAIDVLTKNCVWSVNEGFNRERTEWTHQNNIDVGDLEPARKLSFEQIVDIKLAGEVVEAAGGRVTIGECME